MMFFAYRVVSLASILHVVLGDPIVSIDQGQLNGTVLHSRGGKSFYAFYAIPYTQPPIDDLRFAPPQKAPSWQGIRDATQKAPICLQPSVLGGGNISFVGQEDCLYLSVFTPELKPEKPLPVLVYIHGGAFRVGSGDGTGPHYFMDKPIVMVTLNHRLGIFGYLSAADDDIPGNYGLKDQVAALKWLQSNIANFGGDPKSVTIMGQSSGSVSVHLHTLSPLSKGLFHRAVMESGSALALWSHYNARDSQTAFLDIVERLNCKRETSPETLQCLRRLSANQLIRVENNRTTEKHLVHLFRPAIERSTVENAFMVASPFELRYQNSAIPWITGINSAEAMFAAVFFVTSAVQSKKNLDEELRADISNGSRLLYFVETRQISKITDSLMKFYFENGTVSENDVQKICDLLGDAYFNMPTLQAAYNYSAGPVYFYYFDYRTDASFNNTVGRHGIKGADHSDELKFLFSHSRVTSIKQADIKLSEQMVAYWTNFVITGNPNSPNANLPPWDRFEPYSGNYLHIANDVIATRKQLLSERYAFWKKLGLY